MKKNIALILFFTFSSQSFAAEKINTINTTFKNLAHVSSLQVKMVKDDHESYESIHQYDNDWANQNNG